MERIFRIDFYPQEWLVETGHMSLEQRGIYINICAMIYSKRGPILNDASHIARLASCSPRLAKSLIQQLIKSGDLIDVGDNYLTQKRCERELKKKRTHLESSSKGGRNKAENESKSKNNNELNSSEDVFSLHSSYPSPSPTTSVDKSTSVHQENLSLGYHDGLFEAFWKGWLPFEMSKGDKRAAEKSYHKARKETDHETIIRGRDQYLANCRELRCKTKHAATWLNNRGWEADDAIGPISTGSHDRTGGGGRTGGPTALELALGDRTRR